MKGNSHYTQETKTGGYKNNISLEYINWMRKLKNKQKINPGYATLLAGQP